MRELSYQDDLTGLKNRRYFNDIYDKVWNRHRREQAPLSLFMADIDYFKIYNDTYGHPRGDTCLETIAEVFRESLRRTSDVIARYGGEEFIGLIPETESEGGLQVAKEIRRNVMECEIDFPESPGEKVITISVGVATTVPDHDDYERLIKQADEALYQVKESGRNQVCVKEVE